VSERARRELQEALVGTIGPVLGILLGCFFAVPR